MNNPIRFKKHIAIVGAGPGGLTTAMLLAARGFKVTVCEKADHVGGRNAAIVRNSYKFDIGPTFLMMKFILDEVFEEAGRHINDYLKCVKLEPMYRLQFKDKRLEPTTNREAMMQQLEMNFPGSTSGYDKFMAVEKERFHRMYPCLQKDYGSFWQYFSKGMRHALPKLSIGRSLFSVLGDYFGDNEKLKLSFTFQSKYLGMSACDCPGAFAILPYVEHAFGVYHVQGGLSEISEAMAKVCRELGVHLRLGSPVKQLLLEGRSVRGVELTNGEKILANETVLNADFGYAMKHLVPPGALSKYSPEKVDAREYSCSTFMLYFRPRNKFEELANCYLVGGGTHPGSGLPTIYESGRIAANLIARKYGVEFISKNTEV